MLISLKQTPTVSLTHYDFKSADHPTNVDIIEVDTYSAAVHRTNVDIIEVDTYSAADTLS